MKKARRKTRKRRVIGQRSIQINQRTKPRSLLQKDHVINHLVGRKEIGRAKGRQNVDTVEHMSVNGHEVRALRKTETGHGAKVHQEKTKRGRGAEAQEEIRTGHGVEAQKETETDHEVGVLEGKDLEAEVQEEIGTDHEVPTKNTMTNKNGLHQKKSKHI